MKYNNKKKYPKKQYLVKKAQRGATALSKKVSHLQYKDSLKSMFRHYVDHRAVARRLHMPIPDGYRTVLTMEWSAYEGLLATAETNYQVFANSAYLPLNVTGYTIAGVALASPPGTPSGETVALAIKNPAGLSRLINGTVASGTLYDSFHTLRSRIRIQYIPEGLSNSLELDIVPVKGLDNVLSVATGQTSQQPYSKYGLITTSTPHMYVTNWLDIPKFLGVSEKDYVSDFEYATNVASGSATLQRPSGGYGVFWNINRRILTGQAIAGTVLPYKIFLEYDVIFKKVATSEMPQI